MDALFNPHLPDDPEALEAAVAAHEKTAGLLKPDTRARIVWNDEQTKNKTSYAIVYLHGFKSSQGEGDPVHQAIAQKFGFNLYLSRLYGHGQKRRHKFDDLTPARLIQSAEDACRIGQKIGKRVLLMGTSTGGSLALHLAAQPEFSSYIDGLILYSPLIHFYGIQSLMLEGSLSRHILQVIPGKHFAISGPADPLPENQRNIWYSSYQLNGPLALGKMIARTMKPSTFRKVQCPTFVGYYYRNEHSHDRVVSTPAIERMSRQLGTPPQNVVLKNFPRAGSHVICSTLLSNAVQDVIASTETFITDILKQKNARMSY